MDFFKETILNIDKPIILLLGGIVVSYLSLKMFFLL